MLTAAHYTADPGGKEAKPAGAGGKEAKPAGAGGIRSSPAGADETARRLRERVEQEDPEFAALRRHAQASLLRRQAAEMRRRADEMIRAAEALENGE